jgi:hypothetical protein
MVSIQPITLYEVCTLIISVAGFLTVIVSLVLLIRQASEMTKQTRSVADALKDSSFESMRSLVFRIDEVFLEYPELYPYFYEGENPSETDELLQNKLSVVAGAILDTFLSIIQRRKHFPHVLQLWPQVELNNYFRFVFSKSPFLCNYLETAQDWYVEELATLMEEGRAMDLHMRSKASTKYSNPQSEAIQRRKRKQHHKV